MYADFMLSSMDDKEVNLSEWDRDQERVLNISTFGKRSKSAVVVFNLMNKFCRPFPGDVCFDMRNVSGLFTQKECGFIKMESVSEPRLDHQTSLTDLTRKISKLAESSLPQITFFKTN